MVPLNLLVIEGLQFFQEDGVFLVFQINGIDVNPEFKNSFEETEQVLHLSPLDLFANQFLQEWDVLVQEPNLGKPNHIVREVVDEAANGRIRFQNFEVHRQLITV
jgi:hypothetical protein